MNFAEGLKMNSPLDYIYAVGMGVMIAGMLLFSVLAHMEVFG